MLCNCCVRELLILARTWFAFGLPSKTGCDSERDQSRGRAAEAESRAEALGGQLAEASARAGALAADLAVGVGSAQSARAAASEQRARAEGMSWLFRDFDSASFFNLRLKTYALAICKA
jgi:hypothetical protein